MASADGKKVILIAVDESKESMHGLEWSLDHLFSPALGGSGFKIILIHVKPPPISLIRISGPGAADVMSIVEKDIKKWAATVTERAKEICNRRSVPEVEVVVAEGDARNILCEAVDKYHAEMLVVGSHGYGAFKRVILGSVSDYCAHHAHCSVLIVKMPKAKPAPA